MKKELEGKRLLLLGGFNQACDIILRAQEMGAYVVVADYNPNLPGKDIADTFSTVSATDVEALVKLAKEERIDGVTTGFVDILLQPCYEVCKRLGLPYYATSKMIEMSTNKVAFKETCMKYGVPVPQTYLVGGEITDDVYSNIKYPVFVKPLDASGSRGAGVCYNSEQLDRQFSEALSYSVTNNAIIEDYITGREFLLDYMAVDGEYRLLSMFDRYKASDRGSAMNFSNISLAPSHNLDFYMKNINDKVITMFRDLGFKDGLMFLQGYCDGKKLTFFEMGCRLGGSFFNHQRHFFGDDAMRMVIRYALTGKMVNDISQYPVDMANYNGGYGADINFLLKGKQGRIDKIVGVDTVRSLPSCIGSIQFENEGYQWKEDRTVDRAIFVAEIAADSKDNLVTEAEKVYNAFNVYDDEGNSLLTERLDTQDLYKD